jgi:hypothetical protein
MADGLQPVLAAIDAQHADRPARTRRQIVAGAAATLGGMGVLGAVAGTAGAQGGGLDGRGNDAQTILNVAATAEVLATIVNTVGAERVELDAVTRRNVRAAAREELIHYNVLVASGGKAITKRIWVPDAVFANATGLLSTLEVGDQIFVNAYLIAVRAFGIAGNGRLALFAAETMGVEAVHRALARQSLGKLGNDRVFMKFDSRETAPDAPNRGQSGFGRITTAAAQLQAAGFGLGAEGAKPGRFYDFDAVRRRTPDDPDLNTRRPDF